MTESLGAVCNGHPSHRIFRLDLPSSLWVSARRGISLQTVSSSTPTRQVRSARLKSFIWPPQNVERRGNRTGARFYVFDAQNTKGGGGKFFHPQGAVGAQSKRISNQHQSDIFWKNGEEDRLCTMRLYRVLGRRGQRRFGCPIHNPRVVPRFL